MTTETTTPYTPTTDIETIKAKLAEIARLENVLETGGDDDRIIRIKAELNTVTKEIERKTVTLSATKKKLEAQLLEEQKDVVRCIEEVKAEVKADVIAVGSTVKGEKRQAVFTKGRLSIVAEVFALMCKKYAGTPVGQDIEGCAKVGEPSIAIREVK